MNAILSSVLEKARDLSEDEQHDLASLVDSFIDARAVPTHQLSDEQVAEVARRLEDPNPRYYTLEEVRQHIDARLA